MDLFGEEYRIIDKPTYDILTPEFDTSDTVYKYGRDYDAVVANRI